MIAALKPYLHIAQVGGGLVSRQLLENNVAVYRLFALVILLHFMMLWRLSATVSRRIKRMDCLLEL